MNIEQTNAAVAAAVALEVEGSLEVEYTPQISKVSKGNKELEDLNDWFERDKLVIPRYQRNLVVKSKWQNELVRTLLDPVLSDIPGITLRKLPNGTYELVDGQQRMTTIHMFMDNQISYTPKGKRKPVYFRDLPPAQQVAISGYQMQVTIYNETTTDKEIRMVFTRLNTGSNKANQMEILRAAGFVTAIDFLESVNRTTVSLYGEEGDFIDANVRFGALLTTTRIMAEINGDGYGKVEEFCGTAKLADKIPQLRATFMNVITVAIMLMGSNRAFRSIKSGNTFNKSINKTVIGLLTQVFMVISPAEARDNHGELSRLIVDFLKDDVIQEWANGGSNTLKKDLEPLRDELIAEVKAILGK